MAKSALIAVAVAFLLGGTSLAAAKTKNPAGTHRSPSHPGVNEQVPGVNEQVTASSRPTAANPYYRLSDEYYGYSDPYYGDNYAYDPNYAGDGYDNSYAYDNGATFDSGLPLVTFGQQVPVDQTTVAMGGDASYCAQRYRSYDPASGTYLGFDGLRHPCQ